MNSRFYSPPVELEVMVASLTVVMGF